jgi:hypothetical protein
MRKLLLVFISILCFGFSKAQTTTKYIEFNTGLSFGTVPMFPGASFLYGATTKFNSGVILDYQGGLAIPSIVTGKAGVGFSIDPKFDVSVGFRAFPSTLYIQLLSHRPNRYRDIVFTIEMMSWEATSFGQSTVLTVGWRPNIKK